RMYNSHILQENLAAMKSRGISFAGPETGTVACGDHGTGKMSDPLTIADLACAMAGQNGNLKGKRILISAGPTCEKIDPVRFITNRSSGKMGYAIADAAVERGAVVTLVSGPVSIKPHKAVTTIPVVNVDDMLEQVLVCYPENDILIMAAAVADWKMVSTCDQKWKKSGEKAILNLVRTPDILQKLASVPRTGQLVVGFAAETEHVMEEGIRKLKQKRLDAIVVNDVSISNAGFGVDTNCGTIIDRNDGKREISLCSKRQMADIILDHILTLL
ncbi:bifunctional phosphopantothenoylcysteine decarboxylase/phosphopantothenate--cysteine ligase CoaBC, partial [bacterium]|nr:bifunctional phosphopantothenoylcysteine decarboxylase/phosphopantothenate--cysteine ligase CoaBC [bacterium]